MKASGTAAVLGLTVGLGLAGCSEHAGTSAASPPTASTATGTPRPPPPSTPATPSAPDTATAAPSTSPADPASVVESFYAAINAHDYRRAWDLGGSHLGRPYADFAGGFADTVADVIGIDDVNGNTVDVHLHALHTDGSTADYAGSYVVENGTITYGSLHLVATSSPTRTPVPSAPGGQVGTLNPDVTQATIHSTICVPGWTASIRPPVHVTEQLKREQLAASGAADKDPSHYEEDHIIPLELGGAPADPANLRPVPLSRASADDRLENSLHRAVCDGAMTLTAAQSEIERAKASETQP
ncbi:hypothetical protein [Streptomyces sp. NPDC001137]|uniref:hypothetical protein n=1 Tax=Streptomyces sp. NPDC001137 TaxID=3154378 RepID=UPI00332CFFA7